MDESQKALLYGAVIGASAANKAVVRMHAALADKGILEIEDMERLRHLHLLSFDVPFDETPNQAAREWLAGLRDEVDYLWQEAAK